MSHLSLQTLLGLLVGALGLLLVAHSTHGFVTAWRLRDDARRIAVQALADSPVRLVDPVVDHLVRVRRAAQAMGGAAGAITRHIGDTLASGRPWTMTDLNAVAAERVRVGAAWRSLAAAAARPDAPAVLVEAVAQAKRRYFAFASGAQQELIDTLRIGWIPQTTAPAFRQSAELALAPVGGIAEAAMQAITARAASQRRSAQSRLITHGLLLLIAVLLIVFGLRIARRRISFRIHRLTSAMAGLAAGDLSVSLPHDGRRDEISGMQHAVQVFREEMARAEHLAKLTEEQRQAEEQLTAEVAAELEAMTARQGEVVETIVYGLMQLSEGNLAFSLTVPLAEEYEMLRMMFNQAVAGLQATVRGVLLRAQALQSGTGEIAQAAGDLARRTQMQAASLAQTAASLTEITATVQQTAAGSARARAIAATAQGDAETSAQVVAQSVRAMENVEASAREIGDIIELIDDLARQTNLLALNAGVEARRAGEHGRGFAVIASEIRALALHAGAAAEDIKRLVGVSMQHVARGVRMVGETGSALQRIRHGVGEINGAIAQIAGAAQQQSGGLAEVSQSVNQMDQVTRQNAAMVEQSRNATVALARETQELNRAVARFKIAEASEATADAA